MPIVVTGDDRSKALSTEAGGLTTVAPTLALGSTKASTFQAAQLDSVQLETEYSDGYSQASSVVSSLNSYPEDDSNMLRLPTLQEVSQESLNSNAHSAI
jgi:hypothetical protein